MNISNHFAPCPRESLGCSRFFLPEPLRRSGSLRDGANTFYHPRARGAYIENDIGSPAFRANELNLCAQIHHSFFLSAHWLARMMNSDKCCPLS